MALFFCPVCLYIDIMDIFEENENLLDRLESAEDTLESIRIGGVDSADEQAKKELALEIKTCVADLVDNVRSSGSDAEVLGGAVVLMDLIEVFKRYNGIFEIEGMGGQIEALEKMYEDSVNG